MKDKKMEELAIKIKETVIRAGKIITEASDIVASEKGGNATNMVTAYDVAVQNFLIEEIKKLLPDAYFVAEEKENDEKALLQEFCFIIDPIDGTANFVHGYRHSCISVAMLSYGDVVFSCIHNPYLSETFYATKGGGAFLNGNKIQVSERNMPHAIVGVGTSPYHKARLGERTFRLCRELFLRCSDLRRSGSAALDLAYLAAGRTDIFFEAELCPWDFAAGWLLVREAGGIITQDDGTEVNLSRSCPIIASNKVVYGDLLEISKNCK